MMEGKKERDGGGIAMCTQAEERAGICRIGFGSKRDGRPTEADHDSASSYLILSSTFSGHEQP
jgi:hypothetical protein